MDAKLKALKVVDLKQILAKANVSVPAKATKGDLITRIQASKQALEAYAAIYPQDDLLAPPEEVDWNDDQIEPSADTVQQQKPKSNNQPAVPPTAKPASSSAPAPVPEADSETATTAATTPAPDQQPAVDATETDTVDEELEKRKKRAARFGIALVEPQQPKSKAAPKAAGNPAPTAAVDVDPKKLEARAARFGIKPTANPPAATTNGKKRSSPETPEIDAEEQERRRKRAERFGAPNKA
ncbi:hypothetical protein D9613_000607 [Agrocybe pediades]|uniref:THO1-MOS11 C-terminal domain-containing protein n=1 Tax=Agrocybe pediades TaxID=84607 RepID=A0A8H4QZG8_9AGAR|nr:hypothetical protein D9613_000607 [Agrocybe pediades]KAF9562788.1 hypothetical protein CPC08DRAFT_761270 [Agrocybe pediades]